jgi:cytochrome P450
MTEPLGSITKNAENHSPNVGVPTITADLFSDDVIQNSLPMFRNIRDSGSLVWLSANNIYAAGRFADVRVALGASEELTSTQGIWVNENLRPLATPNVLTTGVERHEAKKRILMKSLTPKALSGIRDAVEHQARTAVAMLANGEEFEAMATLASHIPIHVVANMVGYSNVDSAKLLKWAAASFNFFGPADNQQTISAGPLMAQFIEYAMTISREHVVPGSWLDHLFTSVDHGEISIEEAHAMVFDYSIPSLDTTILATGEMLYRLATEPGLFDALKTKPELISAAVLESVRLGSPIRGFTRVAMRDMAIGDAVLPKGSRVILLYGAANHDERHYADPEKFDLKRNPRDQLGWGYGPHLCAGMHLAKMEMEALLRELVNQVDHIEIGQPERLLNSILQGYARIPMKLTPARKQ